MADEDLRTTAVAVAKAPRAAMISKLLHMIHTAEFVSKRRPSYIRMNDKTLDDYFRAMKPEWSGRDWDGIPIILDGTLEYCQVGMVFDVGTEE